MDDQIPLPGSSFTAEAIAPDQQYPSTIEHDQSDQPASRPFDDNMSISDPPDEHGYTIRQLVKHNPSDRIWCRICHVQGHSSVDHIELPTPFKEGIWCYKCHAEGHNKDDHGGAELEIREELDTNTLHLFSGTQFNADGEVKNVLDVYNYCTLLRRILDRCWHFVQIRDLNQEHVLDVVRMDAKASERDVAVARLTYLFDESNMATHNMLKAFRSILQALYQDVLLPPVSEDLVRFRDALHIRHNLSEMDSYDTMIHFRDIIELRLKQGLGLHEIKHQDVKAYILDFGPSINIFNDALNQLEMEVENHGDETAAILSGSNYATKPFLAHQIRVGFADTDSLIPEITIPSIDSTWFVWYPWDG